MTRMQALAAALLLAFQTAAQEPYPGQSNHAKPPDGWTCEHQNIDLSVPPEHACNCERSCDQETGKIVEDQTCTVFCHSDSCRCTIGNMKACK